MHLKQRMLTVEVWFFCFYVALKMQYVTKKEKVRQPPPVNWAFAKCDVPQILASDRLPPPQGAAQPIVKYKNYRTLIITVKIKGKIVQNSNSMQASSLLGNFYSQNGNSTFWAWETQFPDRMDDLTLRERSLSACLGLPIPFCLVFMGTYEPDLWDSWISHSWWMM